MKKILLVALIVVTLGFGYGCKDESSKKAAPSSAGQGRGAFKVRTVKARSVDLPLSIIAVGTLEPNEEVMVSAEVSAKLTGLFVDEGDGVVEGKPLVVLDEEKFILERDKATAELDKTEAELEFAEKDLKRKVGLLNEGMVSKEDYESALSRRDSLTSAVASAKAELLLKARELVDARVTAPFDGSISERYVAVGSYVKEGDRLFRLIDISSVKVAATIPERFLGRLSVGQEVSLAVASTGADKIYRGVIYFISPEVDSNNRSFKIKARIENSKKELRPGLFAEVTVVTGIKKGVFLVPEGAVLTRQDKTVVFIERSGKVTMREVEVLERRDAMAVVVEGLEAGEAIVVEGAYDLDEGVAVRVVESGRKARK